MKVGTVARDQTVPKSAETWAEKDSANHSGNLGLVEEWGTDALSLHSIGNTLGLFSQPGGCREKLDYIGRALEVITQAWSQPREPDPDAILGVLQQLAANAVCATESDDIRDDVNRAMLLYRKASEAMFRARLDAKPSERDAAWEFVLEGHALLGQAIRKTSEKH